MADDVAELARSLGYTTSVTSRVDERWPKKPVIYKVSFRPDSDLNPFLHTPQGEPRTGIVAVVL